MSVKKKHDIALELMLQASQKLVNFSAGYSLDEFLKDQKTQSASIMQLIIIGELAKKLPQEIKRAIDLPWRLIAGFRDLAVHEYFELDLRQIWDTVSSDIPNFRKKLLAYVSAKQQ